MKSSSFLNWSITVFQCCVSAAQQSESDTRVSISPPSWASLLRPPPHPTRLGHHSAELHSSLPPAVRLTQGRVHVGAALLKAGRGWNWPQYKANFDFFFFFFKQNSWGKAGQLSPAQGYSSVVIMSWSCFFSLVNVEVNLPTNPEADKITAEFTSLYL